MQPEGDGMHGLGKQKNKETTLGDAYKRKAKGCDRIAKPPDGGNRKPGEEMALKLKDQNFGNHAKRPEQTNLRAAVALLLKPEREKRVERGMG